MQAFEDAGRAVPEEAARDEHPNEPNRQESSSHRDELALGDVLDRVRDATAAAEMLVRSASDAGRLANTVLKRQLETHAAATLGATAGVGFVLAGGLASPAARTFVRLGARFAIGLAMKRLLEEATRPRE